MKINLGEIVNKIDEKIGVDKISFVLSLITCILFAICAVLKFSQHHLDSAFLWALGCVMWAISAILNWKRIHY